MSKGNTFENDLMKLIFQATAIANIADNASSSPNTQTYVALHTADPGEAGGQDTSEIAYTGYARVAVARSTLGWSISANAGENVGAITFGSCTTGSGTATNFSVGTTLTGSGKVLYKGTLTSPLFISAGITPVFSAGSLDISED